MLRPFQVIFWGDSESECGPAWEEYQAASQPDERRKIQRVIQWLQVMGFRVPGLRVELVKGTGHRIYELKISSLGVEHRLLAAIAPWRSLQGREVLVMLKYIRKKKPRLDPTDIETAVRRAKTLEQERP